MPQDYNKTINLPKTDFPMRASLPAREPGMLEQWNEKDIYNKLIKKNEGKPRYILHDGPPFSNGYIHMGTALNKCLKDFIVRYKNMSGWQAPYMPGWDNHGMPIESAIIKKNKLDRKKMSIPEFRDACQEFASNFVDIQRNQFIRLGVIGSWDKPYLTMAPSFEAEEVRIFGQMYEKGYIYKGKKPVYWCPHDETALAEAEIEYQDDACESIYVKFPVNDDRGKLSKFCDLSKLSFVIWTTTTWTIPGNLAICLSPKLPYVLAKAPNGECYILAKDLLESVGKAIGVDQFDILAEMPGAEFEFMTARHPLYERDSVILVGNHVTLDAGTGCVHTAPGHGHEDFDIVHKYNAAGLTNIGILVPIDDRGHMTEEAGPFAGMYYEKANKAIAEALESRGALLASKRMNHQYAHCWRCKEPILYRATDQWFCSVDAIKDVTVDACKKVRWLPAWGEERMISMIRERSDWCISRQRHWGLPIPVFYCEDCSKPVCTPETIEAVAALFEREGSNAWFSAPAEELLPGGFQCPHCGGTHFSKETDTLDGWFDSGSTHIAALEKDNPQNWPSTMYLEGADQFRGWFQSSLLTSVAVRGRPPYDIVLTHGWTVDGEGKAMHKSLGNSILPEDLIPKYGADLVRLWAASADYRVDMRCSDNIFRQLSDMYLKIRNTARYILGNLDGFDPDDLVPLSELPELDRWALAQLNDLVSRVHGFYEDYEFYRISHAIHNFCVVDMSTFYLDIIKDRLYCEGRDSLKRRSAQTAMYLVLDSMVRMLGPILAFTAEEIWAVMPHHKSRDAESVLFNDVPDAMADYALSPEIKAKWEAIRALRLDVNKALESARAEKLVGKPLESEVTLSFTLEARERFGALEGPDLAEICIVSKVSISDTDAGGLEGENFAGVKVLVEPSKAQKCTRCWTHLGSVGSDPEHPELCHRCAEVVKNA